MTQSQTFCFTCDLLCLFSISTTVIVRVKITIPPFVKLLLPFTAHKKDKWKLIFVKAPLKHMRVCAVRSNTKCVILIVEAPPHDVFVLTDPPTDSAPSSAIHPSLLLLSHPLSPSLPPLAVFSPSWGSVLLSHVWLSTVKMGRSERMLYLPRSLTIRPWFVIYTLVWNQADPFGHYQRKQLDGAGWIGAPAEVASSRLGPRRRLLSTRRHFSQQQQQHLMSTAGCFLGI